ncbi:MAG: endonuclease domain-containing protein [Parvibaculaceae bacterium]
MRGPKPRTRAIARRLRCDQTRAEQQLWKALRSRRLGGFKFLRQVEVEGFFVDFVCREHKLIVEVDGATHSSDSEILRDRHRDETLARAGYDVLRVQNMEVYEALASVCDLIHFRLTNPPKAPHPPPAACRRHLLPAERGAKATRTPSPRLRGEGRGEGQLSFKGSCRDRRRCRSGGFPAPSRPKATARGTAAGACRGCR